MEESPIVEPQKSGKDRVLIAIVTLVICAGLAYALLRGKKNDYVFQTPYDASPRTLIHFTNNADSISGVSKPEKGGACAFYVRSVGVKPAEAQLIFEARFNDNDSWQGIVAVPHPPAERWVGYRGPMFPQMRFRISDWKSGDGIEADLCQNDCPGLHSTVAPTPKPLDPNSAVHP